MKDKTYSTREVAQMLGVTVQTVQRWVDAGHLRAWKTAGGHRRLAVDSVEAFIRDAQMPLTGPTPTSETAPALQTSVPASNGSTSIAAKPTTVLVVDDEEGDRELAIRVIRSAMPNAIILEADNGFSGLLQLGRNVVDLLLTDISMPHLDGLAMVRTVRADPALARVRIAAMSSHDLEEVKRKGGLPAGVEFFPKPLRRDLMQTFLLANTGQGVN